MDKVVNDLASLEILAVVLITIGLDALPKLKAWWGPINKTQKQLIIVGIMFLISVVSVLVRCYRGEFCPADPVDWIIVTVEGLLINFIVANGTYFGTRHITKGQPE